MAEEAVIVTLEVNIPGGSEGIFIMHGECEIRGITIVWHWDWTDKEGLVARLFKDIDRLGQRFFATPRHHIRVRVRVKGHMIWRTSNGRRVYLDGQTFGIPGEDRDGRPRIDLQFPSGGDVPASDFESWFSIRE
jgi:hypothetical protein